MPAIHWTNGWVGPSRGSGHWEESISASAANQTKTPRSSSPYNIEVSFHTTHAPVPTQPSTDSAQPKQSLPQDFIFKNVWTKVITSLFRSHVFLCGSTEQDLEHCSDPLQPLHIWHTSLLCSPRTNWQLWPPKSQQRTADHHCHNERGMSRNISSVTTLYSIHNSYLTENTKRLRNRDQLLSAVQGHNRCLLRKLRETRKHIIGAHQEVFIGWANGWGACPENVYNSPFISEIMLWQ